MRVFKLIFTAALLAFGLAAPAGAAGRSVYTSLASKDCRFDPIGKGAMAAVRAACGCTITRPAAIGKRTP